MKLNMILFLGFTASVRYATRIGKSFSIFCGLPIFHTFVKNDLT